MTLLGFAPRNHPQQVQVRGANDDVDQRITPDWFLAELEAEFGPFTLDVAANAANAKAPSFFDRDDDGLAMAWGGASRVWCNPPYSALAAWVAKAWAEHRAGCPLIVMFLPANRTEQPWWQDLVEPHRDGRGPIETRFVRRRIPFGHPEHQSWNHGRKWTACPFGSVLLIWRGA